MDALQDNVDGHTPETMDTMDALPGDVDGHTPDMNAAFDLAEAMATSADATLDTLDPLHPLDARDPLDTIESPHSPDTLQAVDPVDTVDDSVDAGEGSSSPVADGKLAMEESTSTADPAADTSSAVADGKLAMEESTSTADPAADTATAHDDAAVIPDPATTGAVADYHAAPTPDADVHHDEAGLASQSVASTAAPVGTACGEAALDTPSAADSVADIAPGSVAESAPEPAPDAIAGSMVNSGPTSSTAPATAAATATLGPPPSYFQAVSEARKSEKKEKEMNKTPPPTANPPAELRQRRGARTDVDQTTDGTQAVPEDRAQQPVASNKSEIGSDNNKPRRAVKRKAVAPMAKAVAYAAVGIAATLLLLILLGKAARPGLHLSPRTTTPLSPAASPAEKTGGTKTEGGKTTTAPPLPTAVSAEQRRVAAAGRHMQLLLAERLNAEDGFKLQRNKRAARIHQHMLSLSSALSKAELRLVKTIGAATAGNVLDEYCERLQAIVRKTIRGHIHLFFDHSHHTGAVVDETSVIISSVSSELKGMIDGIDDHDSPQLAADVAQMLETLRSAYTEHMAEHQMDMLIDGV